MHMKLTLALLYLVSLASYIVHTFVFYIGPIFRRFSSLEYWLILPFLTASSDGTEFLLRLHCMDDCECAVENC